MSDILKAIAKFHSDCMKKKRYDRYSLAVKVNKKLGKLFKIYGCAHCSGFHLAKIKENK